MVLWWQTDWAIYYWLSKRCLGYVSLLIHHKSAVVKLYSDLFHASLTTSCDGSDEGRLLFSKCVSQYLVKKNCEGCCCLKITQGLNVWENHCHASSHMHMLFTHTQLLNVTNVIRLKASAREREKEKAQWFCSTREGVEETNIKDRDQMLIFSGTNSNIPPTDASHPLLPKFNMCPN